MREMPEVYINDSVLNEYKRNTSLTKICKLIISETQIILYKIWQQINYDYI